MKHICRAVRKADKERDEQRKALGLPEAVQLLPLAAADSEAAALVVFGDVNAHDNNWRRKRRDIQTQSIFAASQLQPSHAVRQSGHKAAARHKRKGPGELAAAIVKRQRLAG